MRERERRALFVIEKNLIAQDPSLAEQFAQLDSSGEKEPDRRHVRFWVCVATAPVLLFAVAVGNGLVVLITLLLAGLLVVWWML